MAEQVTLSDRYEKREGRILISGVQALVRLMLLQADRDAAAGLKTGGFVSGYRGSPLGTVDSTFASARKLTDPRGIVVMPAVNEELAATAIAGTQQIEATPDPRVQGVYSLWYGKGPGLDRAADAIRHGNIQGSSPLGGVVLAVGDDHIAKSSTVTCYSDDMVAGLHVPLFYPADPAEVIEYGLHGFAMSRHTGSWTAIKIVTDIADSTRTVDTAELTHPPILPPLVAPGNLHNRWPDTPLDQEARQVDLRLPAVADYVFANGLDRALHKNGSSKVGIVAAGKSWKDLLSALELLGLDEAALLDMGVALYKPAVIWPLEQRGFRQFAEGLQTILFVEEKGGLVEGQAKALLYNDANKPAVYGKYGPDGGQLLPATGELTPERIAAAIHRVVPTEAGARIARRAAHVAELLASTQQFALPPAIRRPFFCSGCPHNRSTVLPDGSRAYSGIGCHGMAAVGRPRHSTFCQMGGEGVHWVGLAPFTNEPHAFANLGDGTYFHSGILAIRQAVAAGTNITYKILYNSAVAMTGGQPVDGELPVEQLAQQLRAEGVAEVVVVTDAPERYVGDHPLRGYAAKIEHRDELDAVQRELRTRTGVNVILYDQMCATEKRRLRKRGKLEDPTTRVFINTAVCEACGDCSAKSNCISVEPVPTPHGIKRRINQSSCNKDYSCVNGFCPSFVTLEGAKLRKVDPAERLAKLPPVPAPEAAQEAEDQHILVAGIGGTGVVTIGALIAMAGHMGGKQAAVLDQVGLAQKGGSVTCHVHVGDRPVNALRIPAGRANLILGCDQLVGNGRDVMAAVEPGRTKVLVNSDTAITGDFAQDRNAIVDASMLERRLAQRAGADHFAALPFTRLAEQLLGDAIGANLMMVGYAWQRGWLGLDMAAFEEAVELNGVGVGMNKAAVLLGRRLAADPESVKVAAGITQPAAETVDEVIERLSTELAGYQNQAYAERYRAVIARVQAAAAPLDGDALVEAAARGLYKLMAYKDEYEVARLYTDGRFASALAEQFEDGAKLNFHLAPPIMAKRDKVTGEARKRRFGPWMMPAFRALARLKGLRGTALDPFGYTDERRTERALIGEYEALLDQLLDGLTADNLQEAVEIARLAIEVRGYGHIKERAVEAYRAALPERLAAFATRRAQPQLAEAV